MKHLIAALLLVFVSFANAYSQRDSTLWQTVYGKLVTSSSSQISIREDRNDGTSAVLDISIVPETMVDGCTLDSVQPGVYTVVSLSPLKIYPPRAEFVKFDGCLPTLDLQGVLESISPSSIVVTSSATSDFGPSGSVVSIGVTSLTSFMSCDGRPLTASDLKSGDDVYIRAVGTLSNPLASLVQCQSDCMQVAQVEGTFVAIIDSTIYIKDNATSDTIAININSTYLRGGIPSDSTQPVYSCDGRQLRLEDLAEGNAVSVSYLILPRDGNYLQYVFVKEKCPVSINGIITSVTSAAFTVNNNGTERTVTVASSSTIAACTENLISLSDLRAGMYVTATAVEHENSLIAQYVKVLDDCPFAFSTQGTVAATNANSIEIDGFDPATGLSGITTLELDRSTQFVDCTGLPARQSDIQIGNIVLAYYRMSKGARIADMVLNEVPCETNSFKGTIEIVAANEVKISNERGEAFALMFDDSSRIVNCQGTAIRLTPNMEKAFIEGNATSMLNGGFILNATVYVDCVLTEYISGQVTRRSDSIVTITTATGTREAFRNPSMIITTEDGKQVDWSELSNGRQLCLTIDKSTSVILRGITDVVCDNGVKRSADGAMIVGTLTNVRDNELVISTQSSIMTFALTSATQMMNAERAALGTSDMTVGSLVRVTSKQHNSALQPIATSVVLLSATSVSDEQGTSTALVAHPNPASTSFTFMTDEPFDSITISTMLGAVVASHTNARTVDVSPFTPGIYFVRARRGLQAYHCTLQIVR